MADLPTYYAPYTEDGAVEFITKAMENYNQLKDMSDIESLNSLVKFILASFYSFTSYRKQMCDVLIKTNYVVNTSVILESLMKLEYLFYNDIWNLTLNTYHLLGNFSDCNKEIATEILQTSIPGILVNNIIYNRNLSDVFYERKYDILRQSIIIVLSVARHPENKGPFILKEFKQELVNLIQQGQNDFIALISLLTLAVVVDESEAELLDEGKNAIKTIIKHTKTANKKADKQFRGFRMWELINGLRCISINDNMKKSIVKEGGIEVLIDILKTSKDDNDVECCLGTLLNLCFDKDIQTTLKEDYDIEDVIKPFKDISCSKIKSHYNGIVWLLENRNDGTKLPSSVIKKPVSICNKYDIFFSYSWSNKNFVLTIREELLKSNIKIWIDVDEMKGPIYEEIANGIENATIFVMAVSECYKISPICRIEAEYALSLKKPIIPLIMEYKYKATGWLGLITGGKKYHEFSDRREFKDTIRDLLGSIGNYVAIDGDNIAGNNGTLTKKAYAISKWSMTDVQSWLTRSQLDNVRKRFFEIDGVLLESMIEMANTTPDYFYQTLKSEFEMKLVDILRFNVAIKKLSR